MKLKTITSVAALALVASLALSACSSDDEPAGGPTAPPAGGADSSPLDAVTVTGMVGAEPTVEFASPVEVTEMVSRVLVQGDGPEIEPGQLVSTHYYAVFNDGELIESTWQNGREAAIPEGASGADWMDEALTVGRTVGSRVLLAFRIPGPEGVEVTVIAVVDILAATTIPERAEGEPVTPPAGLPTVTLGANGEPTLGEVPADYRDVTELVVQPLIVGDGSVVTPDDFLTVHYTGWLTDGTVFDSSWENGEPIGFPLTGVVAGWTQGLSGQTVGSQVLLIIPPAMGYGETDHGPIPGGSTLIFVVDILAAN